jgi:hypothetical protein
MQGFQHSRAWNLQSLSNWSRGLKRTVIQHPARGGHLKPMATALRGGQLFWGLLYMLCNSKNCCDIYRLMMNGSWQPLLCRSIQNLMLRWKQPLLMSVTFSERWMHLSNNLYTVVSRPRDADWTVLNRDLREAMKRWRSNVWSRRKLSVPTTKGDELRAPFTRFHPFSITTIYSRG